jgi:nucleotide-binding universal stress UspA family protein
MFNQILVPLDGSTLAERALPHAEQFARIFGSNIILLQVIDPTSYHENPNPVDPLSWQIRKAESDMYMKGITTRMRESLSENVLQNGEGNKKKVRVEYLIREGKPAENIIDYAQNENIDLVIISSHGSGGLSRWNMSSITKKVTEMVYLPVLIVRSYDLQEETHTRIHYRHILLPIDSSRRAEYALTAGIALARGEMAMALTPEAKNDLSSHQAAPEPSLLETKLILAAVIKPLELPIPEPYPTEIEQISGQLMQISRQAVNNYLNETMERLPVKCETRIVENHSISSAIHELSNQDEKIDLVVLCAHGYTGQSTWPYGNVTHNYVEYGTKTVLVIQDVSRSQVRPTAAEIAAVKTGRR